MLRSPAMRQYGAGNSRRQGLRTSALVIVDQINMTEARKLQLLHSTFPSAAAVVAAGVEDMRLLLHDLEATVL